MTVREVNIDFIISTKDAKIAIYASKYHTNELVDEILANYNDISLNDIEKKEK